ncbi:MAG: hypothetical protein H7X75_05040 [Burkholderiaceae bacterium]|nr:hypothetical protein [Burkholderiaceae bacterium]
MKVFESLPSSEAAIRRLILARVVAGAIVVLAFVVAPTVQDSIATGNLTSAELATSLYGDVEVAPQKGADVLTTEAAPVEPLSMSY